MHSMFLKKSLLDTKIKPDLHKLQALVDMPPTKSKKELQTFVWIKLSPQVLSSELSCNDMSLVVAALPTHPGYLGQSGGLN